MKYMTLAKRLALCALVCAQGGIYAANAAVGDPEEQEQTQLSNTSAQNNDDNSDDQSTEPSRSERFWETVRGWKTGIQGSRAYEYAADKANKAKNYAAGIKQGTQDFFVKESQWV